MSREEIALEFVKLMLTNPDRFVELPDGRMDVAKFMRLAFEAADRFLKASKG